MSYQHGKYTGKARTESDEMFQIKITDGGGVGGNKWKNSYRGKGISDTFLSRCHCDTFGSKREK